MKNYSYSDLCDELNTIQNKLITPLTTNLNYKFVVKIFSELLLS